MHITPHIFHASLNSQQASSPISCYAHPDLRGLGATKNAPTPKIINTCAYFVIHSTLVHHQYRAFERHDLPVTAMHMFKMKSIRPFHYFLSLTFSQRFTGDKGQKLCCDRLHQRKARPVLRRSSRKQQHMRSESVH